MTYEELTILQGWITARRDHGRIVFIELRTVRATANLVVSAGEVTEYAFNLIKTIPIHSALDVTGAWTSENTGKHEFRVHSINSVEPATAELSIRISNAIAPQARTTAVQRGLDERHLSIRSDFAVAALTGRARVHRFLMGWMEQHDYVEVHAPVLTKLPLYDDGSAVQLSLHDQELFLTQCVGFYLEAAALALGKVYNIGPSFRAEDSRSNRHLVEYWHVKFEALWTTIDQAMTLVEDLVCEVAKFVKEDCEDLSRRLGTKPANVPDAPFRRYDYRDVVRLLRDSGLSFAFGDHIGSKEEALLSDLFAGQPIWVTGNPAAMEPFPYRLNPENPDQTLTADLILPDGYGELLGVAEKIKDKDELLQRMSSKSKDPNGAHSWVVDLRDSGSPTHSGVGMGFERLLRWLFQTKHVRDYAAFPRLFGRQYWP